LFLTPRHRPRWRRLAQGRVQSALSRSPPAPAQPREAATLRSIRRCRALWHAATISRPLAPALPATPGQIQVSSRLADDRFGRCDVAELRIELTRKQSSSSDSANDRNATAAVVRARYFFSAGESWEGSATASGRSSRPPPLLQPWRCSSACRGSTRTQAAVPSAGRPRLDVGDRSSARSASSPPWDDHRRPARTTASITALARRLQAPDARIWRTGGRLAA
jgi:hypothetical protein